jgi:hypothetical protein
MRSAPHVHHGGSAGVDNGKCWRPNVSLAQIATGDLDVTVLGQLPATNLPLRDQFEAGSVAVIGFETPLRSR